MVIVKFLKQYGSFQPGEVGGVGSDVAKKLLAGGHVELYGDGSAGQVPEDEKERDVEEEMVVVRFIKPYSRFQAGEIGGVYKSSLDVLLKPDPVEGRPTAEIYGDGRITKEPAAEVEAVEVDGDDEGAGTTDTATETPFDGDDMAAMQDVDDRLEDKIFVALGAAGITNAAAVVNAGMAGLQADVNGVGKKTSEKLISAATKVLRDRGVSI